MRELTVFCSARDRDVRIVVTDEPVHEGQAPVLDPEMICLEVGESCAGRLCPVCALSADALDARLAKSGLRPDAYRSVRGRCDACEREAVLVLTFGGHLNCTECGATRSWRISGGA